MAGRSRRGALAVLALGALVTGPAAAALLPDREEGQDAPAISPDGRLVAYAATHEGNEDIWVARIDGRAPVRVTTDPGADTAPAWSPDGRRLAFESFRDGNAEIYGIGVDGRDERRLTDDPAYDAQPAFSPDGRRLAFQRAAGEASVLWVMDADGGAPHALAPDLAFGTSPSWSRDGGRIAYTATRHGNTDVQVVSAAGGPSLRLTAGRDAEVATTWSPDGRWIRFVRWHGGALDLYEVRADGVGPARAIAVRAPRGAPPSGRRSQSTSRSARAHDRGLERRDAAQCPMSSQGGRLLMGPATAPRLTDGRRRAGRAPLRGPGRAQEAAALRSQVVLVGRGPPAVRDRLSGGPCGCGTLAPWPSQRPPQPPPASGPCWARSGSSTTRSSGTSTRATGR
jgi:WD40 repeat protein